MFRLNRESTWYGAQNAPLWKCTNELLVVSVELYVLCQLFPRLGGKRALRALGWPARATLPPARTDEFRARRRSLDERLNETQEEFEMGKIVVSQFVSVDGVIEDPGGAEEFDRGGWAFKYDRGPEGDKFKLDEVMAADALLLGRVTYEGFAAAWPSREGEFADKFNGMRKYVVSSTLTDPDWNNSVVIEDDVPGAVAKIRDEPGGDVLVNGSAQLVQTLREHDLVD